MLKIFDFFTKKVQYTDFIIPYSETRFSHWFYNSWIYTIYLKINELSKMSFKYDILYKYIYLKLQNRLAVPYDSWSLNCNVVDYLLPRIIWLKDNKHGVSMILVEECIKNGLIKNSKHLSEADFQICYSYQQEILWEMAKGLACEHLIESYKYDTEQLEARVDEAYDLIKKYRYVLYD